MLRVALSLTIFVRSFSSDDDGTAPVEDFANSHEMLYMYVCRDIIARNILCMYVCIAGNILCMYVYVAGNIVCMDI